MLRWGPGTERLVVSNFAAHQDEEEEEADENSVEGLRIAEEVSDGTARVLCTRCYSLTHYGCAHACRCTGNKDAWAVSPGCAAGMHPLGRGQTLLPPLSGAVMIVSSSA